MPVEQQIAIIFCGSRGLLQKIPLQKVHNFEVEFLHKLEDLHGGLLEKLRKGQYTPEIEQELETVALELIRKYEAK